MRNPSYLTLSADGKWLESAASEVGDSLASAVTLRLDSKTGAMQMLGSELTDGDLCYISTNGKVVMAANYSSGMSRSSL